MANDLRQTWDDIAHHWDDWGPPLRPCAEDLRILEAALVHWHAENPVETVHIFLCGVTPEIVTMQWPFAIDLVGTDQAESMVRLVWPGDVPGVRRAVVGNWLDSGLAPQSQDVVLGDGGFGFFDYPDGQRALAVALRKLLKPGGLFIYRHYAQAPSRESLAEVVSTAHAGRIGNFHIFKWRLAMALQADSTSGVRQHDIWHACMEAGIDSSRLPQPGWSRRAVDTIHFYRDKQARLYFPTLDEFCTLLAGSFERIEVQHPHYELGERCPILTAHPRVSPAPG
jgi:hypothetical protein